MDSVTERKSTAIDGLFIVPLKKIENEKGAVLHILRANSPHFTKFGEVYLSITNPGEIKGWKFHKEIGQNFAVPHGRMRFVFYDNRPGSRTGGKTVTLETGRDDYFLIQVPAKIWYAFKTISPEPGYIINCATGWFMEGESENLPLNADQIPKAAKEAITVSK